MCSTRGARALPRADCSIQKPPDHRLLQLRRDRSRAPKRSLTRSEEIAHALRRDRSRALKSCSSVTSNYRKRIQKLLYGILEISIDLFGCQCAGGDERARTADPLLAKQVLSQLSYIPWDTAYETVATSKTDVSLRTRIAIGPAGGFQTLKV